MQTTSIYRPQTEIELSLQKEFLSLRNLTLTNLTSKQTTF